MWDDEDDAPVEQLGGGDGDASAAASPLLAEPAPPPGAAATLPGPGGTAVVLVGVAHVDPASAADATAAIQATNPAAVVLELDPVRLAALEQAAADGDRYGISRLAATSRTALALRALTGGGPAFMLGAAYAVGGALLGAPAGGEFLAAKAAAESAGAVIVLGDRDQRVTLARLSSRASAAAREAAEAGRVGAGGGPGPSSGDWTRPSPGATGGGGGGGLRPGDAPVFTGGGAVGTGAPAAEGGGGAPPAAATAAAVGDDPSASIGEGRDPWGLSASSDARARRWKGFLEAGGCANADGAVAAFKRIMERGLAKGGDPATAVDDADVAAVRRCGRAVVSSTRSAALAGGSDLLKSLEAAAVASAAGAAGPGAGPAATHLMSVAVEVLGAERDIVLGRALWDAAAAAPPGSTVVGVVGAAHVAGIVGAWGPAGIGSPAGAAQAVALRGERRGGRGGGGGGGGAGAGAASVAPAVMTLGLLAMLAARKPKAALFIVGSTAALTLPLAYAAAGVMGRYERLAVAVGRAAERVDGAGPGMEEM
jgi:hypothetical protein